MQRCVSGPISIHRIDFPEESVSWLKVVDVTRTSGTLVYSTSQSVLLHGSSVEAPAGMQSQLVLLIQWAVQLSVELQWQLGDQRYECDRVIRLRCPVVLLTSSTTLAQGETS